MYSIYLKSQIDTLLAALVPKTRTINGKALSSDVTLAKSDVGLSNVTNNPQYYPGGTDVAVADGGTGASTASAARDNLGLGTLATVTPTGVADGTKFLRDDGAWAAASGGGGSGNVVGQASSVDGEVALFSGTGGKTIKRAGSSGIPKLTSGVLGTAVAGTDYQAPITLTTTGTSGPATFVSGTLNIPQYAGGSASLPVLTPDTYGAAGNGTTDDTIALQNWLSAVANGNRRGMLQSGKIYKITSALTASTANVNNFHIDGNGAILLQATNNTHHLLFTGDNQSQCSIRNIRFDYSSQQTSTGGKAAIAFDTTATTGFGWYGWLLENLTFSSKCYRGVMTLENTHTNAVWSTTFRNLRGENNTGSVVRLVPNGIGMPNNTFDHIYQFRQSSSEPTIYAELQHQAVITNFEINEADLGGRDLYLGYSWGVTIDGYRREVGTLAASDTLLDFVYCQAVSVDNWEAQACTFTATSYIFRAATNTFLSVGPGAVVTYSPTAAPGASLQIVSLDGTSKLTRYEQVVRPSAVTDGATVSTGIISFTDTVSTGANRLVNFGTSSAGDASTNTSTSVDSEVALFSGTAGKTLKRATGSGIAKLTSGVLSTATAGTDYYAPGSTDVAVSDGGTGASTAAAARANLAGYTSTATAAGTTTMVVTDAQVQQWTGTTTQTVKLPTTSVAAGDQRLIINDSTGIVTVQSSGANTIVALPPGTSAWFTARQATPTTAAHWQCPPVIWKGTQSAYAALGSYDSGVVYVTDGIRVVTVTQSATPTINCDTTDVAVISGLAQAVTGVTVSGTPKAEQKLWVKWKDNGTARAIVHGSSFTGDLLTTTVANKWHRQLYVYDTDVAKFVGVAYQAGGY